MLTESEINACELAALGATSLFRGLLAKQATRIARLTGERDAAINEVKSLRRLTAGLAERVAAQAELLAKRAEKTP